MDDKDLERTKPIRVLNELNDSRSDKYKKVDSEETRSERYEEVLKDDEKKVSEELAEEALAEKNIAMAEAYLAEENKEEKKVEEPIKKKSIIAKFKDFWSELDKKKKIMFIVIILLLVILIGSFIFFLIKGSDKPEDKPVENVVEEAPVLADNFYYKSGSLYFLDDVENEIGSYECENKDSNLCYVIYNNNRDDFDIPKLQSEDGSEILKRTNIYENDYVFIFDNEEEDATLIKLYSISKKEVIEEYNDVKTYDDSYVVVSDMDNKYGLIKIENGITEVVPFEYDYLGMIDTESNLIAKNKKGFFVIDMNNKKLSSYFDESYKIKNYNENFVVALVDGDYNLYDYKADLIKGGYNFISINGNYAALVDSLNLYLIDKDGNKYNEGNIKLESKEFVKTYIYDKEENLVETRRSFEWSIKDNVVELVIYEDGEKDPTYKNVNLIEGKINSKLKYVSYFDGKLYFYKDEDKQELLGSYSCSNKNEVSKETDSYSSCFIAKDTIYENNDMMSVNDSSRKSLSALINDTFVFISDGNNEVKLYNLNTSKIMGTYTSVNTYMENNDYTFDKFSGHVEVVGMNKKGKYGVLEIDGSDVKALYTFDYNKIERLGEYYLVQDVSNSWKMLFDNSETALIPGKILGYNSNVKYIKASVGNKYAVYDIQGNSIGNGYKYVELYSDFYAAVNTSNELFIYDYMGTQLSNNVIQIGNYSYTKTETPAFKVKYDGNDYIVSVYNGKDYDEYIATMENGS